MVTYTTDPIRVVDVDSHYTEPPGLWIDRAPAKFKERVPRIVENEQGLPQWVVDGNVLGAIGNALVKPDGTKITRSSSSYRRWEEVHPGAYDVKARLAWLDSRGIAQQAFFPNIMGFGSQQFYAKVSDIELRNACVTIYNDAVAEVQRESGERLLPLALVPFWDIEQAVKEVKRVRTEVGLHGITMTSAPQDFGFPSLNMPEWKPFWSTCEELDIAVCFHIGSGGFGGQQAWIPRGSGASQALGTAVSYFTNVSLVSNLIITGVLLNHPRLKVFSSESGIGWVPFLLETMDYQWQENMSPEERREVTNGVLPSDLFRRHFYVSYWFEQRHLAHDIDLIGEDNVMFETDFPHGTALTDSMTEQVAETLASLRTEVRRKVLHDNAARLYNLPA
jgi:predicted TIM-barrel fold metal-dependent hydrolase